MPMIGIREFFEYGIAFLTIFITVFFLIIFLENQGRIRHSPKPPRLLPSLTIIIPAYNEEETIAGTIESALNARYAPGSKKVIVVDDGSTDQTLSVARRYAKKGVLVLHQENRGKAAALNNALGKAGTELVATLDSDSYIEKDALLKMVGFFNDAEVGAVTSVMKVWKPRTTLEKLQRMEYLLMVFSRRLLSFIDSVNVTPGPLSIFRKRVFDAIGGYDEGSILEDQEFGMRMQAHNYRIASSMEAVVYTVVPKTFGDLISQRVRWHRGGVRNLLKHHRLISPRYGDFGTLVMPFAILSIAVLFILFFLLSLSILNNSFTELFRGGFDTFYLGLKPIHLISIIIVLGSIAWVSIGIRQLEGEPLSPHWLIIYLLLYAPLVTLFWLVTAYREMRGERLGW